MASDKLDIPRFAARAGPGRFARPGPTRRRLLAGLIGGLVGIPAGFATLRLLAADFSGVAGAAAQDLNYFRIGGGSLGSRLYELAGTVAGAITNPPGAAACDQHGPCGVPGLIGLAQTTTGSLENLQELRDGTIESGITQADIAGAALAGTGPFKADGANPELRCLARLGRTSLQIAVAADSPLQKIADLKGRVVALGPKPGDSALTGQGLLAAYGITAKKAKLDFRDIQTAIAGFQAGQIDALVLADGLPNGDLGGLAENVKIRLLPIEGAPVEQLLASRPYLAAGTIPSGIYPGQEAAATIEVPILWTVSAKLDNHLAYSLAKALASQAGTDASASNAGRIDFGLAAETSPIRLHPGAQTYFEERKATETAPSTN